MGKWVNYNVNICDNIFNDLEIHFTKACENNCPFCIDKLNAGIDESAKPNVNAIFTTILVYSNKFDEIGIAGGEPCLYLDELHELCTLIKKYFPTKKLTLITSIPEICFTKKDTFYKVLELCDYVTISPQHHNQEIADKIRGRKSGFDREEFYKNLPHKEKISITINLIKNYLDTLDDVKTCLLYYNKLGFNKIKLCELSQRPTMFVNLEEILGIKLKSPFASGCVTKNYNTSEWLPEFNGTLTLKRTCFYNNCLRKANLWDLLKAGTRWLFRKKYFFGVIYGNGNIYKYWK